MGIPDSAADALQLEIMRKDQGIREAIDGLLDENIDTQEIIDVLERTLAGDEDDEPGMSGGLRPAVETGES